jgi:hypothetical protein
MTWVDISAEMAQDATITSDRIIATATYEMWSEEHLWNVSVLQRVHLSNLKLAVGYIMLFI